MKRNIFGILGILALITTIFLNACSAEAQSTSKANVAENQVVLNQQDHYNKTQPVPYFDFSLKRQILIDYYKAANSAVSTFSYVLTQFPQPQMHLICPSVSFPIQGGTQLTNGQQATEYAADGTRACYNGCSLATIGQAEPDGSFSPANGQGTIVLCLNDDGTAAPVYQEGEVYTYPYKLANADEKLMARSGKSSINLDTKQHE